MIEAQIHEVFSNWISVEAPQSRENEKVRAAKKKVVAKQAKQVKSFASFNDRVVQASTSNTDDRRK